MSFLEGYPSDRSQVPSWGYPSPRCGYSSGGYPNPSQGVPQSLVEVPQSWPGCSPGWVPPAPARSGWGTPLARSEWGPPPPGQVTLEQVMPRAVRLLRFSAGGLSCFRVFHDGWFVNPNCLQASIPVDHKTRERI